MGALPGSSDRPPQGPAAMSRRKGLAWFSLGLGILGIPTFGLYGVGATAGIVVGILALARVRKAPEIYGGRGLAITGILLNLVVLFIGFAVSPAFVGKPRVRRNEAQTLRDMRAVIIAEKDYAAANGGLFDRLECLAKPSDCIPGYPPDAPAFLPANLTTRRLTDVFGGYRRTFIPGPPADLSENQGQPVSPSSVTSFAYFAAPFTLHMTGERSFCGDSTGRICLTLDASEPEAQDGLCPQNCENLK